MTKSPGKANPQRAWETNDDRTVLACADAQAGLPGWVTVLHLTDQEGAVVVCAIAVTYIDQPMSSLQLRRWLAERPIPDKAVPLGGITSRMIRLLHIGGLVVEARRQIADLPPPGWKGVHASRAGRQALGDRHHAELAARYVQLANSGETQPVEKIARELELSPRTVRNRLYRARQLGLLTSPGQGRLGGRLTDHAKTLLRKETDGVS